MPFDNSDHGGSMIALVVPDPENYAINPPTEDTVPADELHITLAYLGEADEISQESRDAILEACQVLADTTDAPEALFPATSGMFPPDPESPEPDPKAPYFAAPSNPERFDQIREDLVTHLASRGVAGLISTKHPVFNPHVTLAYAPLDEPPQLDHLPHPLPTRFENLVVTFGPEAHFFPLRSQEEGPELTLTASVRASLRAISHSTQTSEEYLTALYLRQRSVRATPAQTRSEAALESVRAQVDPEYITNKYTRLHALAQRARLEADPARRAFAASRALALAGRIQTSHVPHEVRELAAITAGLRTLIADGNSRAARSLRARRQLRDRYGRWIEMGGGVRFKVRVPGAPGGGTWYHGTVDGIDVPKSRVRVKLEDGRDVWVPNNKLEQPKAILGLDISKTAETFKRFLPKSKDRKGGATKESDHDPQKAAADKKQDDAAVTAMDNIREDLEKLYPDATVSGGNIAPLVNDPRLIADEQAARDSGESSVTFEPTKKPKGAEGGVEVTLSFDDVDAIRASLDRITTENSPSQEELDSLTETERAKALQTARSKAYARMATLYNERGSDQELLRAPSVGTDEDLEEAAPEVEVPGEQEITPDELTSTANDAFNELKSRIPDNSTLAPQRDLIEKVLGDANARFLSGEDSKETYLANLDRIKEFADAQEPSFVPSTSSLTPEQEAFGAFSEDIDDVHAAGGGTDDIAEVRSALGEVSDLLDASAQVEGDDGPLGWTEGHSDIQSQMDGITKKIDDGSYLEDSAGLQEDLRALSENIKSSVDDGNANLHQLDPAEVDEVTASLDSAAEKIASETPAEAAPKAEVPEVEAPEAPAAKSPPTSDTDLDSLTKEELIGEIAKLYEEQEGLAPFAAGYRASSLFGMKPKSKIKEALQDFIENGLPPTEAEPARPNKYDFPADSLPGVDEVDTSKADQRKKTLDDLPVGSTITETIQPIGGHAFSSTTYVKGEDGRWRGLSGVTGDPEGPGYTSDELAYLISDDPKNMRGPLKFSEPVEPVEPVEPDTPEVEAPKETQPLVTAEDFQKVQTTLQSAYDQIPETDEALQDQVAAGINAIAQVSKDYESGKIDAEEVNDILGGVILDLDGVMYDSKISDDPDYEDALYDIDAALGQAASLQSKLNDGFSPPEADVPAATEEEAEPDAEVADPALEVQGALNTWFSGMGDILYAEPDFESGQGKGFKEPKQEQESFQAFNEAVDAAFSDYSDEKIELDGLRDSLQTALSDWLNSDGYAEIEKWDEDGIFAQDFDPSEIIEDLHSGPTSTKPEETPTAPDYPLADWEKELLGLLDEKESPGAPVIEEQIPEAADSYQQADEALEALKQILADKDTAEVPDAVEDAKNAANKYSDDLDKVLESPKNEDAEVVADAEKERTDSILEALDEHEDTASVLDDDTLQEIVNQLNDKDSPLAKFLAGHLESKKDNGQPITDEDLAAVQEFLGWVGQSDQNTPEEKADITNTQDSIDVPSTAPAPGEPDEPLADWEKALLEPWPEEEALPEEATPTLTLEESLSEYSNALQEYLAAHPGTIASEYGELHSSAHNPMTDTQVENLNNIVSDLPAALQDDLSSAINDHVAGSISDDDLIQAISITMMDVPYSDKNNLRTRLSGAQQGIQTNKPNLVPILRPDNAAYEGEDQHLPSPEILKSKLNAILAQHVNGTDLKELNSVPGSNEAQVKELLAQSEDAIQAALAAFQAGDLQAVVEEMRRSLDLHSEAIVLRKGIHVHDKLVRRLRARRRALDEALAPFEGRWPDPKLMGTPQKYSGGYDYSNTTFQLDRDGNRVYPGDQIERTHASAKGQTGTVLGWRAGDKPDTYQAHLWLDSEKEDRPQGTSSRFFRLAAVGPNNPLYSDPDYTGPRVDMDSEDYKAAAAKKEAIDVNQSKKQQKQKEEAASHSDSDQAATAFSLAYEGIDNATSLMEVQSFQALIDYSTMLTEAQKSVLQSMVNNKSKLYGLEKPKFSSLAILYLGEINSSNSKKELLGFEQQLLDDFGIGVKEFNYLMLAARKRYEELFPGENFVDALNIYKAGKTEAQEPTLEPAVQSQPITEGVDLAGHPDLIEELKNLPVGTVLRTTGTSAGSDYNYWTKMDDGGWVSEYGDAMANSYFEDEEIVLVDSIPSENNDTDLPEEQEPTTLTPPPADSESEFSILLPEQRGESGDMWVTVDGKHKWGRYGAAGIAIIADDKDGTAKVLLGKRGDRDEWYLPGGALDQNETAIQGATREFIEEAVEGDGISQSLSLINQYQNVVGTIEGTDGDEWSYTTIVAQAPSVQAVTVPDNASPTELAEYRWVDVDELAELDAQGLLHPAMSDGKFANLIGFGAGEKTPLDYSSSLPEDLASPTYDMSGWKKVGESLGSQPGAIWEDEDGNRYYGKSAHSSDHAQNEILASKLYEVLGVNTTKARLGVDKTGSQYIVTPWIEGDSTAVAIALNGNNPAFLQKIQQDFAVDVWLGNYDAIGPHYNNVIADEDGNPLHVDSGAALLYRGTGAKKSWWGNDPVELQDMRMGSSKSGTYEASKKVFGSMTDDQIKDSVSRLLSIGAKDIEDIISGTGFSQAAKKALTDTLIKRRHSLLEKYGLLDSSNNKDLVSDVGLSELNAAKKAMKVKNYQIGSKVLSDGTTPGVISEVSPDGWVKITTDEGDVISSHMEVLVPVNEAGPAAEGGDVHVFTKSGHSYKVGETVKFYDPTEGTWVTGTIDDDWLTPVGSSYTVNITPEDGSTSWSVNISDIVTPDAFDSVKPQADTAATVESLGEGYASLPDDAVPLYKNVYSTDGKVVVQHADGSLHVYTNNGNVEKSWSKTGTKPYENGAAWEAYTPVQTAALDESPTISILPEGYAIPPVDSKVVLKKTPGSHNEGDFGTQDFVVQHPDGVLYAYPKNSNDNSPIEYSEPWQDISKLEDITDYYEPVQPGDLPGNAPSVGMDVWKGTSSETETALENLPVGTVLDAEFTETGGHIAMTKNQDGLWEYFYESTGVTDSSSSSAVSNSSFNSLVVKEIGGQQQVTSPAEDATPAAEEGPLSIDGATIKVGDVVNIVKGAHKGKPTKGQVYGITDDGKVKLRLLNDDGTKAKGPNGAAMRSTFKAGSLRHESAPIAQGQNAGSEQPSFAGVPTGITLSTPDTDSPLYGTDAPTPPIPPTSVSGNILGDDWIARANEAYKARNKKKAENEGNTWAEKEIQSSSYWNTYYQQALEGDTAALDYLNGKGYFEGDPDLYTEGQEAAAKKAETHAKDLLEYQKQTADYNVTHAAWLAANGKPYYTPLDPKTVKGRDADESHQWMSEKYKGVWNKLSAKARNALKGQKGSSGWQKQIRLLAKTLGLKREDVAKHTSSSNMGVWDAMQEMAQLAGSPGEAWKGIRVVSAQRFADASGISFKSSGQDLTQIIGTIQKDHGAMEFTPGDLESGGKPGYGGSFNQESYDIIVDLTVPPEIKGFYTATPGAGLGYAHEHGFIAEPGLAMYIWDVVPLNGQNIELVSGGSYPFKYKVVASLIPREVLPYMNNFEGAPDSHPLIIPGKPLPGGYVPNALIEGQTYTQPPGKIVTDEAPPPQGLIEGETYQ